MNQLPTHLSYSALSQYESCPRAYYLARVKRAEEKQTWFFPLGSAVHASIEAFIATGDVPKFEDVYYPSVAKQFSIEPDDSKWLAGGSLTDPIAREKSVEIGKACVENAIKFLEDIEVWKVEFDATGMLPGCEVPIKAFADLIGVHKKHGPVIVDWKSSASKPKTNLQLEVYRALTRHLEIGWLDGENAEIKTGLWAMLRPGVSQAKPVDLSSVDPSAIGARFQKCYDDIKARLWRTNSSFMCKFCVMQDNCLLQAGPTERAKYYDDAGRNGFPF